MRERLLLITGAGASRNLSSDPDLPLPLMQDWGHRLRNKLGPAGRALGLSDELDGVQFEETLGAFFGWLELLPVAERFTQFVSTSPGGNDGSWQTWKTMLGRTRRHGAELTERLHESLFEEFGPDRIDAEKATRAFADLFDEIAPAEGSLVCATTNYDRSLEIALAARGNLRVGFDGPSFRTPVLSPEALGTFDESAPSILYLHGAVGWYRRSDGRIIGMPADQGYNSTLGPPAVLYPAPDKDVAQAETYELWRQFERAVEDASHIFVLGHGLNDAHLVDVLERAEAPLAVTYLSDDKPTKSSAKAAEQQERAIKERLPAATPIATVFGGESLLIDRAAAADWRAQT